MLSKSKKLYNTVVSEATSLKEIQSLKKPTWAERFRGLGQALSHGFHHLYQEPEVLLFAFLKIVIAVGLFGLSGFSLMTLYEFLGQMSIHEYLPDALLSTLDSIFQGQGPPEEGLEKLIMAVWLIPFGFLLAYPMGILNGAIGASSFLRQTGQKSTIKDSLRLAMQVSSGIWMFTMIHYTVLFLTGSSKNQSIVSKIASKSLRFVWLVGTMGMMPALLNGRSFTEAAGRSVQFLKHMPYRLVILRGGMTLLTNLIAVAVVLTLGASIADDILVTYPVAVISLIVFILCLQPLVFKPLYIISIFHLYGQFLTETKGDISVDSRRPIPKTWVTFLLLFAVLNLIPFFLKYSFTY